MQGRCLKLLALAAVAFAFAASARAEDCGDSPEGFKVRLDDFKQVAIINGISPEVADSALATATFDRSVLSHDRGQRAWQGNFAAFAAGHVTPGRIKRGKTMLLAYAEPLERI